MTREGDHGIDAQACRGPAIRRHFFENGEHLLAELAPEWGRVQMHESAVKRSHLDCPGGWRAQTRFGFTHDGLKALDVRGQHAPAESGDPVVAPARIFGG